MWFIPQNFFRFPSLIKFDQANFVALTGHTDSCSDKLKPIARLAIDLGVAGKVFELPFLIPKQHAVSSCYGWKAVWCTHVRPSSSSSSRMFAYLGFGGFLSSRRVARSRTPDASTAVRILSRAVKSK